MRTFTLLFMILFVFLVNLKGQTIIALTFTAEVNGNHQPLDSIRITNLTQGGDTTLYGTDTVLVLDDGIGIEGHVNGHGNRMTLFPAYPNPVKHTSTIRLWLPQDAPVTLRLFDLPGRELANFSRSLGAGEHSFTFHPGKETHYLLVAEAADQRMAQKLISLSSGEGSCQLSHNGHQLVLSGMRKDKSSFPWTPGDNLRLIGFTSLGIDTIDDNPVQSTVYTFQYIPSPYPPGTVHCDPANPTAVVDVTNPTTGRIWMDRNLGAMQQATSSTDTLAYGDIYQWGRLADGHQCRTSGTTTVLSNSDVPGHGSFIPAPNSPFDWRSLQNSNLWQGVNGVNNPCPIGYRLPTEAELNAERQSWSSQNAAGALASPLKLPMAGWRDGSNGSLGSVGFFGSYWSSTVSATLSWLMDFNSANADVYSDYRANGSSVRCLKDY